MIAAGCELPGGGRGLDGLLPALIPLPITYVIYQRVKKPHDFKHITEGRGEKVVDSH